MAEHKPIGEISVVTDTDTGMETVGEVRGGFNTLELEEHIKQYGSEGILSALNYMIFEIVNTKREINAESSERGYIQTRAML